MGKPIIEVEHYSFVYEGTEKKVLEEPVTAMPVGILVMGAVMWLVTIFYANLGMHANSYHSLVSFL